MWIGIDVGGANLKLSDGRDLCLTRPFPLWQRPGDLAEALRDLVGDLPTATSFAATMTGELADCYRTKNEGVRAIITALEEASAGRQLRIYCVDGRFVAPEIALDAPLLAAASNWHALARFAGRFATDGPALLIDVGSTTTDVIPLAAGQPVAQGRTDPERLMHGELVYTGVIRSPVCAVVSALPFRGGRCSTAHEHFATTLDAYLTLGEIPEQPDRTDTADGRPATKEFAQDRLARSICADRLMFGSDDARAAAETIAAAQIAKISIAVRQVATCLDGDIGTIILSGEGEFLGRSVIERLFPSARTVSLNDELGAAASRVAPAYALAILVREEFAE